jgi:hypothetical protein
LEVLDKGLEKFPWSDRLATYKGGWHYDQGNWTYALDFCGSPPVQGCRDVVQEGSRAQPTRGHVHHERGLVPGEPAQGGGGCVGVWWFDSGRYWYQLGYDMKPSISQLLALTSLLHKFNNWTNYEQNMERILKDIR